MRLSVRIDAFLAYLSKDFLHRLAFLQGYSHFRVAFMIFFEIILYLCLHIKFIFVYLHRD